jgi:hypothetical protein
VPDAEAFLIEMALQLEDVILRLEGLHDRVGTPISLIN